MKNAESPKWLKDKLVSIGQKPISAIVDVTNYIMFDLNRPLHAYDADKINKGIVVRNSKSGSHWQAEIRNNGWPTPYPKITTFYETAEKFFVYFDSFAKPEYVFVKRTPLKMTNYIDGASKKSKWDGIEFSIKISPTMQLSIFKGSQKGGLVCANGVCAVQPSFENGTKITFRALF